jgi:uncharacterized membrane protein (DUF2068 family)
MMLIVRYKLAKGGAELLCASGIFILLARGGPKELSPAAFLRHHLASALSLKAAKWLFRSKPLRLYHTVLALVLDGASAVLEGVALFRGYWWAPWLVVAATGLPLPLEIFEIVRGPHAGRIIIFCANVLIVVYLARRTNLTISASG